MFDLDVLGGNDTYSLATLSTNTGYVVDIRTDSFREAMAPMYCTVMKNGEMIFPLRRIGFTDTPRKLEFALVEGGEKDEIVAIVEKTNPYIVLAIYDLKTRKSGVYSPRWKKDLEVMRELLQHLNKGNTGKPFILPSRTEDLLGRNDTYSLTTLSTNTGYMVDIRTDNFQEAMTPIYCTVTKNGETIFPLQRAGFTSKPRRLEFALVEGGEKHEIIAVIEKEKPHVVLAIYDLENHKSWYENQTVRQELLQRLNKHKEGQPFVWLGHVQSTPQSKIHY